MLQIPVRLFVGLGLCSLGGVMLYIYFKNKDENEDITEVENVLFNDVLDEHNIKNEILPIIMGRNGMNIKRIEEATRTTISFSSIDDNYMLCKVRGKKYGVQLARTMLNKEIEQIKSGKIEVFVSQNACKNIIGRCGENLQEICRKSLAKISIETSDDDSKNKTRIIIDGNPNQVDIALQLIEEKIQENEIYQKTLLKIEQKRLPRRTLSDSSSESSFLQSSIQFPLQEKLSSTKIGQTIDVYVSAIASPSKFWIQIISPQSQKLDQLCDEMTEFYENEENQKLYKIDDEPYLGQIVATVFKFDGKWYRAKIVRIVNKELNNPNDVILDLYFVDYGDSEYMLPNEVFSLRSDFLGLKFQAIECCLANVKPPIPNEENLWDVNTICKFEKLTYVAQWRKLEAKIISFKDQTKDDDVDRCPIPEIELFDEIEGNTVNIGEALISPSNFLQSNSKINTSSNKNFSMNNDKNLNILDISEKAINFVESKRLNGNVVSNQQNYIASSQS